MKYKFRQKKLVTLRFSLDGGKRSKLTQFKTDLEILFVDSLSIIHFNIIIVTNANSLVLRVLSEKFAFFQNTRNSVPPSILSTVPKSPLARQQIGTNKEKIVRLLTLL